MDESDMRGEVRWRGLVGGIVAMGRGEEVKMCDDGGRWATRVRRKEMGPEVAQKRNAEVGRALVASLG